MEVSRSPLAVRKYKVLEPTKAYPSVEWRGTTKLKPFLKIVYKYVLEYLPQIYFCNYLISVLISSCHVKKIKKNEKMFSVRELTPPSPGKNKKKMF